MKLWSNMSCRLLFYPRTNETHMAGLSHTYLNTAFSDYLDRFLETCRLKISIDRHQSLIQHLLSYPRSCSTLQVAVQPMELTWQGLTHMATVTGQVSKVAMWVRKPGSHYFNFPHSTDSDHFSIIFWAGPLYFYTPKTRWMAFHTYQA